MTDSQTDPPCDANDEELDWRAPGIVLLLIEAEKRLFARFATRGR